MILSVVMPQISLESMLLTLGLQESLGTVLIAVVILISTTGVLCICGCPRRRHKILVGPREDSMVMMGLGRQLKLGRLYALPGNVLLPFENNFWTQENIKRFAMKLDKERNSSFSVISDDSLQSKFQQVGVEGCLAIDLINKSIKTSRSAEYLQDKRVSSRQARVVLRYQCATKYKEINIVEQMKKSANATNIIKAASATHVVVGVEYGAEAYFIFDKDVPDDEDYDETCRLMKSLVSSVPELTIQRKTLNKEEEILAGQLRCTLYSDIPAKNPKNFEDAIEICNRILPDFTMLSSGVPKKVWLFPLNKIDKKFMNTENIEQSHVDQILITLDRLHLSHLKINHLQKHEILKSLDCIKQQLKKVKNLIKQNEFRKTLTQLLPRIIKKKSKVSRLEVAIRRANDESISIENWLDDKEKEMDQISEYLRQLKSPGVTVLLSQSEFNSFTRSEGASNCIISFELELYQSENFDLNEKHQFSSDIERKIKLFTLFAHNCQESKCVVTAVPCDVLPQGAKILLYEPKKPIPRDFNFPIPVKKPFSTDLKSWDRITIEWPRPYQQIDQPIGYTVSFQPENRSSQSSWATKDIEGDVAEAEIDKLEPNTEYVFKVAPMFNYGRGPDSEVSDAIVTHKQPLPNKIMNDSTLSEKYSGGSVKCSKNIWKLKTKLIEDDQQMVSKVEFGKPQLSKHTKIFMAMGATGAGKSTLINGMINHILGVKYDDDFRFVLISDETKETEAHSQTSAITVYTFYWQEGFIVPYNLIFIDTPGFGDTRGMDRDYQTVMQLTALFSKEKIELIHAIGFVVQASLVRLTTGQRYIFDSVQSIFGKDVVNNIVIMATFADDDNPKAMEAIKAAKVAYACTFAFNNNALYAPEYDEMKEFYWNFCSKNMNSFFNHLAIINPTSLYLTRDVLNERKQYEMILNGLQPKIQDMSTKVEILQTEKELLIDHESDILSNKSFTYTVKVTKQRTKNLEPGVYVTNCLNCSFTCHSPCSISDDSKKYECSAMNKGGQSAAKCTVCPKKCPWNNHFNNHYCFESYDETVTRTSEELRERYNIAENSKEEAARAIEKLQDELDDLSRVIYRDLHEARRCQEFLSKIALKESPMSDLEYIDQLIETEINENNPGASSRIAMYSNMKKKAKIMVNYTEDQIEEELQKKDKRSWYQVLWDFLKK